MFKKSPLKSKKILRQKRKALFLKIAAIVTIFLLCVFGLSWASKVSFISINDITVEGNAAVEAEELKRLAKDQIGGNYIKLFSRANRFIYPEDAIAASILTQYQRVKSVDLNVNGKTLDVRVVERKPSYTWCKGTPETQQETSCYFLDEQGYIFTEAPVFSGNAYVSFYGIVEDENPLGSTYLGSSTFKTLDKLISYVSEQGIHPYALLAQKSGTYELYIEPRAKILFKADQDIDTLIDNIRLVMENTELLKQENISRLEYIDLRFGNKLYYKVSGDKALQIGE